MGITLFEASTSCRPSAVRCASTAAMKKTPRSRDERVQALRQREIRRRVPYLAALPWLFEEHGESGTSASWLSFLIDAKQRGKKIVAIGAAGKGNMLAQTTAAFARFPRLHHRTPIPTSKASSFPGTGIPIVAPEMIRTARPDYVLILRGICAMKITKQAAYIREWGGQFVVPIPEVPSYDRGGGESFKARLRGC